MSFFKRLFGFRSEQTTSSFPGFCKFASGQRNPQEFTAIVAECVARVERGTATTIVCFFGFDSEKDRARVCAKAPSILQKAASKNTVREIAGRNYLLRVEYSKDVPYDVIIGDANRLKSEYNATDASIIPIPKGKIQELFNVFGEECCPFLHAILTPEDAGIPELLRIASDSANATSARVAAVKAMESVGSEEAYDALERLLLEFVADLDVRKAVDSAVSKHLVAKFERKAKDLRG